MRQTDAKQLGEEKKRRKKDYCRNKLQIVQSKGSEAVGKATGPKACSEEGDREAASQNRAYWPQVPTHHPPQRNTGLLKPCSSSSFFLFGFHWQLA